MLVLVSVSFPPTRSAPLPSLSRILASICSTHACTGTHTRSHKPTSTHICICVLPHTHTHSHTLKLTKLFRIALTLKSCSSHNPCCPHSICIQFVWKSWNNFSSTRNVFGIFKYDFNFFYLINVAQTLFKICLICTIIDQKEYVVLNTHTRKPWQYKKLFLNELMYVNVQYIN